MKGGFDSIHSINKSLILSFFSINILFVIYVLFYIDETSLNYVTYANILLNIMLVFLYMIINNKYHTDFEKLIDFFKKYIEDKETWDMPKHASFIENRKVWSLFRKAYIKSNIMKKDYKDLKTVFDKFIPQDIYNKIWFRWYEKIALGNCISKRITIMFIDIMWFTKISEEMTPERSLLLLNIYFDWIWDIIYQMGWYIDKFLWDWIMVIFEDETSDNALNCAIAIQNFIKRFQVSVIWEKINIWIWINSWEVIMWTIWTKNRMDATVIWDNVNIASRLQWLTRKFSKRILMGKNTYDILERKWDYLIEDIWEEHINWKENLVHLYALNEKWNKFLYTKKP
jgi:class 3 adenylate cyclase